MDWIDGHNQFIGQLIEGKKMKKYRVYYIDIVEANSEEEAYDETLKYLQDCVKYQDVSSFNYELIGETDE